MVIPIVWSVKRYGNQCYPAALSRADKASAALFGKTRFYADCAVIAPKKPVMISQSAGIGRIAVSKPCNLFGAYIGKLGV